MKSTPFTTENRAVFAPMPRARVNTAIIVKPGDLLVSVEVQVPVKLTSPQREAIEALAAVLDDDPRAGLFAAAQDRRQREGDT